MIEDLKKKKVYKKIIKSKFCISFYFNAKLFIISLLIELAKWPAQY